MPKVEVIQDHVDQEKSRIVLELAIPFDFLKEAMKHPDQMEKAFAMAFAEAMKAFLIKKNIAQPSKEIITGG
jgi:hypothetical protein